MWTEKMQSVRVCVLLGEIIDAEDSGHNAQVS